MKRFILIVLGIFFSMNIHNPPAECAGVSDMTMELPSGKVFYRDSGGEGVPVVFLHAGSGNSMLWEHQIPVFTKAGYRFIAIDYRGMNLDNGRPERNASHQLINELVTELKLPKFHLLGTAAGGGAAFQYALAFPETLRSLTVTNSIGNVRDKEYTELGNRLRPDPEFHQLPLEFRELGPSYRAANPDGVARWLELSGDGGVFKKSPEKPSNAVPGHEMPKPSSEDGVTWAKLAALGVPTLLMTGDADLYTPPSVLRMFAEHMKHAESFIIPESGHSSFWENPDVFNDRVLEFVGKH